MKEVVLEVRRKTKRPMKTKSTGLSRNSRIDWSQNPDQVIRYEFRGHPLLYSNKDNVGKLLSGSAKDNVKVATSSRSGIGCRVVRTVELVGFLRFS